MEAEVNFNLIIVLRLVFQIGSKEQTEALKELYKNNSKYIQKSAICMSQYSQIEKLYQLHPELGNTQNLNQLTKTEKKMLEIENTQLEDSSIDDAESEE